MKTTNINNIYIKEVSATELLADLKEKLAVGVTHFTFEKKDGSKREAYGTTKPQLFDKSIIVTSDYDENKSKPGVTVYYDLQAMGWRSFITDNLLTVY